MTEFEINNYIKVGSKGAVCVYRSALKEMPLIIMSIYIHGHDEEYFLRIEFDPIDMVEYGEGWNWDSITSDFNTIVDAVSLYTKSKLADWENISKSGRLLDTREEYPHEDYNLQESFFIDRYENGKHLLPLSIEWKS